MLTRAGPALVVLLLGGPVALGLIGTVLPAFGYLPALGGTELSTAPFRSLLAQPGLAASIAISLLSGLLATAISLGLVALFLASYAGTRSLARLQHAISPLLAVPHAAAALGLAFLIAPSGLLVRLLSPEVTGWTRPPDALVLNDPFGLAMTAGLVLKEMPFLLLLSLASLPQIDLARSRALGASLGYGRIAGFLFGSWPRLYRQIRLGVLAVLAFSTSVVDVAIILGPTSPAPLAVRLVGWMGDPDLSMRFLASAGAVLQLVLTSFALLIWIGLEHIGAAMRDGLAVAGRRFRRDAWLRRLAAVAMLGSAATVFAGLAALAVWSVAGRWFFPDALPRSFTLAIWANAIGLLSGPLANTLIAGSAATVIALAVVLLYLMREGEHGGNGNGRHALMLIYTPLLVPQVAFLFGLQLLFIIGGRMVQWPALVLAHLVFVAPYVFLSLSDPWRAYDRRYEAIAAGLGKGRAATMLQIRLPMLLRPILTAAAVGFAVSIGQYLSTLLIGAGRIATVTTEAVALASGGDRRLIGVYAFLQMLLPAAGFVVATLVPALIFRHRRAMRP